MEGHVRFDRQGFDLQVRVNWRAITAFLNSADAFMKAAKATILVTLAWQALRVVFGW